MKSNNSGRKARTNSGPVFWRMSVTLTLFFSRFQIISGFVNLSGSPSAVYRQSYTFQCSVSGSVTLPVNFVRNGDGVCTVLSSCQQIGALTGYSCTCAGQTGTSTLFNLTVNSVSLEDEANWTCTYESSPSLILDLQVFTPVNSVNTNISGSRPNSFNITEGDSAVFTCVVHGAKPAPTVSQILWYVDSNKLPVRITGSPTTTDRLTTLNVTYTANTAHQSQKVFCAAENDLMVDQNIPPVNSTNKIGLVIQRPPDFPSTSGECPDTYIESGQSGTCVCNTTFLGTPAGTVSWITPDGTDTHTQTLVLKSINRKYNNQNYTCQVRNYVQTRNFTFRIKLAFGPDRTNITGNQDNFDADGIRKLTLTCTSSSSSPSVTFTWRNLTSGQILISNEPIREQDAGDGGKLFSQNLVLVPQWYQDGDEIECEIQNSQISQQISTTKTTLRLIYPPVNPPEIRGYKTGQEVYEGDTLNIRCVVSGGKPLVTSVSLSCDTDHRNTSSERDENSVFVDLSFTVTRNLNSKTCQCSAVHQTHRYNLTDTQTLTVYYPPSSPDLVSSLSFPWLEGQSRNLTCAVSDRGNPSSVTVWFKNGVKDSTHTNSYWLFKNLSYTDNSQTFMCQATNNFTLHKNDPKSSENKTLNIYYRPRVSIDKSGPITRQEGQSLDVVNCSADSNPPNTTLNWTSTSPHWTGGFPLHIAVLDRDHHGTYTCTATASSSLATLTGTSQIKIIVNYAPDLTFPSINTTENTSLNINCSADGRPDNMNFKHFKHYWNDVFIQDVPGTTVTGNQYRLQFNPVTFEDSGIYVCSVENGIPVRNGRLLQNKTSSVYVKAAPKIINKADNIVGAEIGNPVVLHKSVFCNPSYTTFTWTKFDDQTDFNNSQVTRENITLQIHSKTVTDSGYTFSLSISNFSEVDIGMYKLTVCNEVGCTQFSVNLTGAGPPLPPKEFQQERGSTSDTVFLSWLPNYPGGNFKQRFILQYKPQSESNWITAWQSEWFDDSAHRHKILFNITDLQSKQVYDIRLSAQSNRPSNNISNYVTLEVTTKKDPGDSSSLLGAAIGGAVGSVTVIVVIVILVIFLRRRGPFIFPSKKGKDVENGPPSNTPAHEMPVLEDNQLYNLSSNSSTALKLPVLEDNDLYYTSSNDGVKNVQLPVLEDNMIYHTTNAAAAKKVQIPGTSGENVMENPESQYSVVIKNKCKQSDDTAKKEKDRADERKVKNENKQNKKGKELAKTKNKKTKGDKRPLHQSSRGDTYENVGIGKVDNTYANAAYNGNDDPACENVKGAKHGRDEDGLLYVGIDFCNTQPSKQVHKTQDKVEYVSIDWNKKAEPLPDEDDKQTKPKT